jgi:aminopeptidase N
LLAQMRQSAMALTDRGPIFLGYRLGHIQADSRVFRGLVYNKSAVVLHMLRRLIGDDAFMAGLKRFYTAFRFHLAGTDDLRAAFEAEAGIPLARFFERWILGSTLPRVRTTTHVEPSGDTATIRIEQLGEVFDLPLTVMVEYVDGRAEELTIPVTSAVVERQIRLRGAIRRIFARDDLSLVTIVG